MATLTTRAYNHRVSGYLRFIGIINAAIWFGAGIFFAAGILPAVFSQDLHKLFGESAYPYFSGAVAMAMFRRFFYFQYLCGTIALLHLLAERLYLGRKLSHVGIWLVVILFSLGLIGGVFVQPHMEKLRVTMYSNLQPQETRERARHSFGLWHGVSQFANLLIISGLLVHLIRVTRPSEQNRYGTFYQIP